MRLDIVIPVYNEEKVLETSIQRVISFCQSQLPKYNWRVVIAVNGSNDNSAQIAQRLSAENTSLVSVVYPEPGRGQALRRFWIGSEAKILIYMDCDLAVSLESVPKLIKALETDGFDLSVGSRFASGAHVERSLLREIISRSYNLLGRLFLSHQTKDLQCGFKGITKNAFVKIAAHATDPGWFFDTELVAWAEKLKLKVAEIPVDWHETRLGERKSTVRLLSIPKQFIKPLWQLRQKLRNERL